MDHCAESGLPKVSRCGIALLSAPVTILDFQGRVVLEGTWDGRPIDVSQWASGAYLIQVGEFGSSPMQKLMVR